MFSRCSIGFSAETEKDDRPRVYNTYTQNSYRENVQKDRQALRRPRTLLHTYMPLGVLSQVRIRESTCVLTTRSLALSNRFPEPSRHYERQGQRSVNHILCNVILPILPIVINAIGTSAFHAPIRPLKTGFSQSLLAHIYARSHFDAQRRAVRQRRLLRRLKCVLSAVKKRLHSGTTASC